MVWCYVSLILLAFQYHPSKHILIYTHTWIYSRIYLHAHLNLNSKYIINWNPRPGILPVYNNLYTLAWIPSNIIITFWYEIEWATYSHTLPIHILILLRQYGMQNPLNCYQTGDMVVVPANTPTFTYWLGPLPIPICRTMSDARVTWQFISWYTLIKDSPVTSVSYVFPGGVTNRRRLSTCQLWR